MFVLLDNSAVNGLNSGFGLNKKRSIRSNTDAKPLDFPSVLANGNVPTDLDAISFRLSNKFVGRKSLFDVILKFLEKINKQKQNIGLFVENFDHRDNWTPFEFRIKFIRNIGKMIVDVDSDSKNGKIGLRRFY